MSDTVQCALCGGHGRCGPRGNPIICSLCGGTGRIATVAEPAAVVEPPREDRLRDDDAHQLDRLIAEALADPSSVSVRESLYVNEITRLRSALSAAQRERDTWFSRYQALKQAQEFAAVSPSPEPDK